MSLCLHRNLIASERNLLWHEFGGRSDDFAAYRDVIRRTIIPAIRVFSREYLSVAGKVSRNGGRRSEGWLSARPMVRLKLA